MKSLSCAGSRSIGQQQQQQRLQTATKVHSSRLVVTRAAAQEAKTPPLKQAPLIKLPEGEKDLPTAPGVYGVYDKNTMLQYIGLSRRVGNVDFLFSHCPQPGTTFSLLFFLYFPGGCQCG